MFWIITLVEVATMCATKDQDNHHMWTTTAQKVLFTNSLTSKTVWKKSVVNILFAQAEMNKLSNSITIIITVCDVCYS